MVESIRLSLTLVFALHLPLLSWMALFNTSEDCTIAAVAHVKIKNVYSDSKSSLSFDPFDKSKPICIGMFDSANANADMSGLVTTQVASAFAATASNDTESAKNLALLNSVSTPLLRGELPKDVVSKLNDLQSDQVFSSQAAFDNLVNYIGGESESSLIDAAGPGYTCDFNKKACVQTLLSSASLSDCLSSCYPVKTESFYNDLQQTHKLSSRANYNLCGDFIQTLGPYLASLCSQDDGEPCKIDKILSNLSDTCSRLQAAGGIMYAGFGLSYLLLFGVLVGTYGTQTNRKWAVGLLILYCITFILFGASFVLYNIDLYGEGADNFFWQPVRDGLENGFGSPVDDFRGNFDSVTVVPDSGYIYLVWILVMNIGLITVIGVSLAENEKNFGLYKKIGDKVTQERSKMIF